MGHDMPIAAQAEVVEKAGLETLLFCPDAWALRHRFINQETGETVRARCGSWTCLYCGPRKVDVWRQLVKAAEPTLFVTLTQVGKTLEEAARVLTTVLQYIRRGSKGWGKDHIGARPAYPIEVFAILEEHSNFEEVGFHWHLLVKGVDYLPQWVVSEALRSATKGRSYVAWVERVKNNKAVGYVTKYLMKEIHRDRRGVVEQPPHQRPSVALQAVAGSVNEQGTPYEYAVCLDEEGRVVEVPEVQVVKRLCKAHRIRYSKHFFPMRTAELRRRLFGEPEEQAECEAMTGAVSGGEAVLSQGDGTTTQVMVSAAATPGEGEEAVPAENEQQKRSVWILYEAEPFSDEWAAYKRRRWRALVEALTAQREGKRLYSRRVITLWAYQRQQLRLAG